MGSRFGQTGILIPRTVEKRKYNCSRATFIRNIAGNKSVMQGNPWANPGMAVKKVLLNTGLYRKVEEEFFDLFDLKTSGAEAVLLAAYGSHRSFYLVDEDRVAIPPREEDLVVCPPVPLRELSPRDVVKSPMPTAWPTHDWELLRRLLTGEKYVLLRDVRDVRSLLERVKSAGIEPTDVLVAPVLSDFRPDWEPGFLVYLAGLALRSRGYLVAGEGPGPLRFFGPDLCAFRTSQFCEGAFLLELLLGKKLKKGYSEESACVIEVEAQRRILDSKHGVAQALKYVNWSEGRLGKAFVAGAFLEAYQIEEAVRRGCGVISLSPDGDIVFIDARDLSIQELQHEFLQYVSDVISQLELRAERCPFLPRREEVS